MTNEKQIKPIALLSFDIEEFFQVQNLRLSFPKESWENMPSSVEKNTDRILTILNEFNVKGTFFVLGLVALKHERLVKKIADNGHEVASHGFSHQMTTEMSYDELKDDLKVSKQILEDIIGKPVKGFRAPNFSISDRLLELLKETGYEYDSSLNLFSLHSRYGKTTMNFKIMEYSIRQYENGIFEIPVSALNIMKFPVPMAGGAYFRLYPFPVFNFLLNQYLKQSELFNFYLHPWELEPEQPKVKNIPFHYKFRHYYGLNRTEFKLQKMIQKLLGKGILFRTMNELVNHVSEEVSV